MESELLLVVECLRNGQTGVLKIINRWHNCIILGINLDYWVINLLILNK